MQLGAVVLDEEKSDFMERRERDRNLARSAFGTGDIYRTSLFTKILCLIVNKLSSLDPDGIGVEMEAGKPSWYDALNGLPGLFGSSISETLEIKRHLTFLRDRVREYDLYDSQLAVFEELKVFIDTLHDLLRRRSTPFEFWDAATRARETFREKTRLGVSGEEITVGMNSIMEFFEASLQKLNEGIEKARDESSNTLLTYFRYEVTEYDELQFVDSNGIATPKRNSDDLVCIRPRGFKRIPLPLFLEGPVHYLRCIPEQGDAKEFAANVRKSALYDSSLDMYKVNASLVDQPLEIGRARVFSPGWLENESIWLHMEYKYMLELLRNELYEEFYQDFKNVCIPFLDPDVYGRSILENSSFIVSSVHPNPSVHGNGFVARLSGATAEFIHMLLLMTVGPRPFRLGGQGELLLDLKPSLPEWLFTRKQQTISLLRSDQRHEIELPADSFSFMFLGSILVTYHNRERKDTFGEFGVKPAEWKTVNLSGNSRTFSGSTLRGDVVGEIRDRKVSRIDIQLQ
jgi:hypothetical protein